MKFCKIDRKTPLLESFLKIFIKKRDPGTSVFLWILWNFLEHIFFIVHLWWLLLHFIVQSSGTEHPYQKTAVESWLKKAFIISRRVSYVMKLAMKLAMHLFSYLYWYIWVKYAHKAKFRANQNTKQCFFCAAVNRGASKKSFRWYFWT